MYCLNKLLKNKTQNGFSSRRFSFPIGNFT